MGDSRNTSAGERMHGWWEGCRMCHGTADAPRTNSAGEVCPCRCHPKKSQEPARVFEDGATYE